MQPDIRWQQRFQNFDRAVTLLREPFARDVATLSELERAGTIRRFELTVELAWKTLKDYLEQEGQALNPLTPRGSVKAAFAAGILQDDQVWIDMLQYRLLLRHTYDAAMFEAACPTIRDRYQPAIEELHRWFMGRGGRVGVKELGHVG